MNERAQLNTYRSISTMVVIGIINIITIPLIGYLGSGDEKQGYLWVAILYRCIFTACHLFCFSKTHEEVEVPVQQKLPFKVQLKSVVRNKPYLFALFGQVLFGFVLYARNAYILYYFTYVEDSAALFALYALAIITPSIIGAACFPIVFRWTSNKGKAASIFAFGRGITMFMLYFFSPNTLLIPFYTFAILSQFFFSRFNTPIYAIIPDCIEYREWRIGVRNDGFQYAFISLGNKIGMALSTSLFALVLGMAGYQANVEQNPDVLSVMHHSFNTTSGVLWILTALVLLFYRLNKTEYNRIVSIINYQKESKIN